MSEAVKVQSVPGVSVVAIIAFMASVLPGTAQAIYSNRAALLNSGPIKVNLDIEISEAARLLEKGAIRSHVEDRLASDGVPVIRQTEEQEMPNVVTQSERAPAQIWVSIDTRHSEAASGYIVSLEISHLQPVLLNRVDVIPIDGLSWHESWVAVVPDGTNFTAATNAALDSMVDDFARDYEAANRSSR